MTSVSYPKGTLVTATYLMLDVNGVVDYVDGKCVVTATEGDISFPLEDCLDVHVVTGQDRVARGYLSSDRERITINKVLRRTEA